MQRALLYTKCTDKFTSPKNRFLVFQAETNKVGLRPTRKLVPQL